MVHTLAFFPLWPQGWTADGRGEVPWWWCTLLFLERRSMKGISAEDFKSQSQAIHWMAEFLTKAFIHWMPFPDSVKKALLFTDFCFVASPSPNSALIFPGRTTDRDGRAQVGKPPLDRLSRGGGFKEGDLSWVVLGWTDYLSRVPLGCLTNESNINVKAKTFICQEGPMH